MTNKTLQAEHSFLRAAVDAHRAKIEAASEVLDEAIKFAGIPVDGGRYAIDLKKEGWRSPSVQVAMEQVERLVDDSGYYWTCSRLADVERLLGVGGNNQVPMRFGTYVPLFGGNVPAAHPSVDTFLRAA